MPSFHFELQKEMHNISVRQNIWQRISHILKCISFPFDHSINDGLLDKTNTIANFHKLLTQVHDNQRFQEHEWNEVAQPYRELDLINQSPQS